MNRYVSVFGLCARSTLYKLIGVIMVMAAAEQVLFMVAMNNVEGTKLLEWIIDDSKIAYAFGIGFLAYYSILCGVSKKTSNAVHTTRRLAIEERVYNWISVIYNAMVLVIFLAAQLAVALILCKQYLNSDISGNYQHVIFTAFYRSDMLHSLLPLEDYVLLVCNILLLVELSILASYSQQQSRRGKHDFLAGPAAVITAATFLQDSGNDLFVGPILIAFLAIYAGIYISKGGAVDEDTYYQNEEEQEPSA